jgi:hypothetical protein
MIDVKLPHFLYYVPKSAKKSGSLPPIIDPRQRAKRPIRIHADPFFFGQLLFKSFPMAFKLPSIESCN